MASVMNIILCCTKELVEKQLEQILKGTGLYVPRDIHVPEYFAPEPVFSFHKNQILFAGTKDLEPENTWQ